MRSLRNRVALVVVALLALGLLTAIVFPTRRLSSTRTVGEFGGYKGWGHAAPTSTGFVAVWEDGRYGRLERQIFATRVTAAGASMDLAGLQVTNAPGYQGDATVDCIGDQCLIAWIEASFGVFMRPFNAATGTFGPITGTSDPDFNSGQEQPAIANDGVHFLLVYPHNSGTIGRFVSATGVTESETMLHPRGVTPTLRYIGGATQRYVLVLNEGTELYMAMFNRSGTLVTTEQHIGTTDDAEYNPGPSMAVYDTGFTVVWPQNRHLALRRFNTSGQAIDANAVLPLGTIDTMDDPKVMFDGSSLMVMFFFNDRGPLVTARFDPATLALTTVPAVLVPSQPAPDYMRFTSVSLPLGNTALVNWNLDDFHSDIRMGGTLVTSADAGVTALPTQLIPHQVLADFHEWPRVARLNDGFVVGWSSKVDGLDQAMVQKVDATANLNGAPVQLLGTATRYGGLDVAFDGTKTWATWAEGGTVNIAALDSNGVAGPASVLATGFQWIRRPRLAFLNGRTLVVYPAAPPFGGARLYSTFIEADGGIGPFTDLNANEGLKQLSIATSATQYAVGWLNNYNETYVSRISAAGVLLDGPGGVQVDGRASSISVASNGTDFLVATSHQNYPSGEATYREFTSAGAIGPQVTVNSGRFASYENNTFPEVMFDGTNYVVAWAEPVDDGGVFDIEQRSIFPDGGLGPIDFVAGGPGAESEPVLARGSQGQVLTAWLTPDFTAGTLRVNARVVVSDDAGFDAGFFDAGSDAGADAGFDAGVADAGADAGALDAGAPDAGVDAGVFDAGDFDAGPMDASVGDASIADAGPAVADAGPVITTDGGTDGGSTSLGPVTVGCGCNSTPASWLLLLSGAALLTRRRRLP